MFFSNISSVAMTEHVIIEKRNVRKCNYFDFDLLKRSMDGWKHWQRTGIDKGTTDCSLSDVSGFGLHRRSEHVDIFYGNCVELEF